MSEKVNLQPDCECDVMNKKLPKGYLPTNTKRIFNSDPEVELDSMFDRPPIRPASYYVKRKRFLIKGKFVSRRKYYFYRLTHWGASND